MNSTSEQTVHETPHPGGNATTIYVKTILLRSAFILAIVWSIGSLVMLQCLQGYEPIPSYGWPFLAVQFHSGGAKIYWEYLFINCGVLAYLAVVSIAFLVLLKKGVISQWRLSGILRLTFHIAILLAFWQSKDFLYDMILYHVENYDQIAYYYWQYEKRPPLLLLISVWLGVIFGFEIVWHIITKLNAARNAA